MRKLLTEKVAYIKVLNKKTRTTILREFYASEYGHTINGLTAAFRTGLCKKDTKEELKQTTARIGSTLVTFPMVLIHKKCDT